MIEELKASIKPVLHIFQVCGIWTLINTGKIWNQIWISSPKKYLDLPVYSPILI